MSLILLVEDDPELSAVVTYLLNRKNVTVITDKTGENVHHHIATAFPDLIIMDVWLPAKLGTELCAEVKAYSSLPIIIFSAATIAEHQIVACKADAFLEKPFNLEDFDECISRFITIPR